MAKCWVRHRLHGEGRLCEPLRLPVALREIEAEEGLFAMLGQRCSFVRSRLAPAMISTISFERISKTVAENENGRTVGRYSDLEFPRTVLATTNLLFGGDASPFLPLRRRI